MQSANVEFVLIGGVAAIIHGSTRMTSDLDVAMPFTATNLERFITTLRPFHPVHATRPDLSLLDESIERLMSARMLLVETDLGRVDAMPEVVPLGSYAGLETVEREIFGEPCRVLAIESLIAVKRHVGRPKDLEVAYELEAVLDRLRAR
ncbi:hypothetical protein ACNOYE_11540 [Nannocystaceae bacterium ST9]